LRKTERAQSEVQKELISSSWLDHDLHLVSKASELWDTVQGDAISFGNRFHELMGRVMDRDDLETVIEASIGSGLFKLQERERLESLLKEIVGHSELREHFEPGLEVMNERRIFVKPGETIIPDRLVFRNRSVCIIDYKTGAQDAKHDSQINQYAQVLQKMSYQVTERLLVYVDDPVTVVKIESKIAG
jgi:ATP-dependent exoDNAse (exonuclease V) beta subunit